MQNQININEFHPETLSSRKPLARLADWANVVDPPASFKSWGFSKFSKVFGLNSDGETSLFTKVVCNQNSLALARQSQIETTTKKGLAMSSCTQEVSDTAAIRSVFKIKHPVQIVLFY